MDTPTCGDSGEDVHPVNPHRDWDGRAKCRTCGAFVVGTPAGWFHTDEPLTEVFGSKSTEGGFVMDTPTGPTSAVHVTVYRAGRGPFSPAVRYCLACAFITSGAEDAMKRSAEAHETAHGIGTRCGS